MKRNWMVPAAVATAVALAIVLLTLSLRSPADTQDSIGPVAFGGDVAPAAVPDLVPESAPAAAPSQPAVTSPEPTAAGPVRAAADPFAPEQVVIGHTRGSASAPVTVIEFSDFGCPFCAKFAVETYPELHRDYVETGKVRWVFVPFVLGMFPNGGEAALAAECAAEQGEDAFWKMHDRLFESAREWKKSRAPQTLFTGYARALGLDGERFESCQMTQRAQPKVRAGGMAADDAGVRATPTFIINGGMLEGALPLASFRQVLDQAVAEAAGK